MSEMIHVTVCHPGGQTQLDLKKSTPFLTYSLNLKSFIKHLSYSPVSMASLKSFQNRLKKAAPLSLLQSERASAIKFTTAQPPFFSQKRQLM